MAALLPLLSSEFVLKLASPTEKELAEVTALKAEHAELLQKRSLYISILNALYSELQQSFVADHALHQEIDNLTAVFQGLGVFDPASWLAPSGGSVENVNDFILHLLDCGLDFIAQFDKEPEVIDLGPSMLCGESALNASAMEVMEAGLVDTLASEASFTVFAPGAETTPWSVASSVPGMSAEQACYAKCTENTALPLQLALPGQKPILRSGNPPATPPESTPGFAEAVTETLEPTPSSTRDLTQQALMKVRSSVPLAESYLLQDTGVEGMLSVDTARCNASLHQPCAEVYKFPQDVIDSPQFTSSIFRSCACTSVTSVSVLPILKHRQASSSNVRDEDSVARAEQHQLLQAPQPEDCALELNSTAPRLGLATSPIPHGLTTLVIRNVPSKYTKEHLLQEWPPDGTYDFLYLPFCLKQKRFAGFAFLNFTTHEAAVHFYSQWHGKCLRDQGTSKRLSVGVAQVQGLAQNLEHIVAHNIMRIHKSKFLPSVFNGTEEVPLEGLLERITVNDESGTTGDR